MKHFLSLMLFLAGTCFGYAGKTITLKQIVNKEFNPEVYSAVTPLNDGESFARISNDKKQIVKCSFKTGQQTGILFDANIAKGIKVQEIEGYILSPDESRLLIQTKTTYRYRRSFTAEYLLYTAVNKTIEHIYLVKLLFNNSESQVTKDGKVNEVLNGIPDWVNEEEFSAVRSFDFSADSKMIAWIRYDEKNVSTFDIPLFKGSHPEKKAYSLCPGTYSYKYPKAGTTNSRVSVQTYDIKSHVTRTMDLPMDSDGYIPRIKFTETPDNLAIITLNRHQNQMDVYIGNARSRLCKLALREKDEKYIREEPYKHLAFFGNHFAMMSDRSGYRQLYWFSVTGQLEKQITSGNNEVIDFYGYDATSQSFYYTAYDDSPLRTAVFKTDLKGKTKKLTTQSGVNKAVFSKTYKYFINEFSNLTTPPVTTICNNEGKIINTLLTNEKLKNKLSGYSLSQKEFFAFKTSEGVELNGWMMKPANFNEGHKYPVILYQYSGPGSQEVKDEWRSGFFSGGRRTRS